MNKNFYVTTPIYYVNGDPHVGSAYTTIAADVISRYKKTMGYDVWFVTGSDEHGQKVQEKAIEMGYKPQEWVDKMSNQFRSLWELLNIENNDFIRTTEERHMKAVGKIINKVYKKGDIYLGSYEGMYCVSCETYVPENQIVDGNKCPDCGKELTLVKEESYFFKMSKYQDQLLKHIEENPNFILPKSRKNEVVSFIKQGLTDLSISRNTFDWGIPLEIDKDHVVYVWFDALTNYLTSVGYENDPEKFEKFWNNGEIVHLLGKDILRFHAIIWPIMLLAAGEKLPEKIVAHGWWTVEGTKMSKSLGNVVDPVEEIKKYGLDPFRYFLLSEVHFGSDGDYNTTALINRLNANLSNDLGNLLNRTLGMYSKYFGSEIVQGNGWEKFDDEIKALWEETLESVDSYMETLEFSKALDSIWKFVSRLNKYIDETQPWILAKTEEGKERLGVVLNNLVEGLIKIGLLVYPYMPESAGKIWEQLGVEKDIKTGKIDEIKEWSTIKPGHKLGVATPIFPRLEKPKKVEVKTYEKNLKIENPIEIDTVNSIEINVVEIVEVARSEKSKNNLIFLVDTGKDYRQIVSGVGKAYKELDLLVGKKVAAILNLKEAMISEAVSQGMLLTTVEKKRNKLVFIDDAIKLGTKIK